MVGIQVKRGECERSRRYIKDVACRNNIAKRIGKKKKGEGQRGNVTPKDRFKQHIRISNEETQPRIVLHILDRSCYLRVRPGISAVIWGAHDQWVTEFDDLKPSWDTPLLPVVEESFRGEEILGRFRDFPPFLVPDPTACHIFFSA